MRMTLEEASVGPVIAVSDLEAARAFYEGKLELRGEETPGGRLLHAGGETVAYLLEVGDQAGTAGWPVASFRVENVAASVEALRERDVPFLGPNDLPFDLDALGVADQGAIAVAWMRDPDGNVLTVFSLR